MPIPRFSKNDSADAIASGVLDQGVAIVESVFSDSLVESVRSEAIPQLERAAVQQEEFLGFCTRIIFNGIRDLPSYRDMLNDSLFHEIGERILGPACEEKHYWTLSGSALFSVDPGGKAQPLHRDEEIYPEMVRMPGGPPIVMGTMFNMCDFTTENGATRFVPGSHTREADARCEESEALLATMPQGSMAFWLGSTLHGFSANGSNESRIGIPLVSCAGWLRQEVNLQYQLTPGDVRDYPERLIQKLGYAQQGSTLGIAPGRNPANFMIEGDGRWDMD